MQFTLQTEKDGAWIDGQKTQSPHIAASEMKHLQRQGKRVRVVDENGKVITSGEPMKKRSKKFL